VPIKATAPKSKGKYVKIESKSILLADIKVSERLTPPNPKKYQQRLSFYKENGFTKNSIDIDENGFLTDGYISYLILKANDVQTCDVNVVRREIKGDSAMPNLKFNIMPLNRIDDVSALMQRVFLEYNAEGLPDESIAIFNELTSAERFSEWLEWRDKLPKLFNIWICEDTDTGEIVGALSGTYDRLDNFFVDSRYHRKGIAQMLFKMYLADFNPAAVLVYASLYAQDFYRKLGFVGDVEEVINKGQRVIKMTYRHEGGEHSDYIEWFNLVKFLTEKYGEEKANALISEATTTSLLKKTDLTEIPGIGKKMARHLINAGYPNIKSLKGKSPDEIYHNDCEFQGFQVDKCALYCYRLAVHYADNDGVLPHDKQKWWDWKD
jgi:GNAT superfamily N-acetyltransferase